MKIDIKKLPDSLELLQKIVIDLQIELTSYKEKYARLIEDLRLARQQRFAPSSEKNIWQPDMFDEAGVELTDELKAQIEESTETKNKEPKNRPVRRSLPKDFPRERIVYDIPESEKICACGRSLSPDWRRDERAT